MNDVRARNRSCKVGVLRALLAALLAASTSGCLMTGFDPLDDEPSSNGPQAGDGASGMGFTPLGGQGGGSGQGGASGGSGGAGGTGGARDAGAGSGGTMSMTDASVPMDAGTASPECAGKRDLSDCEDGKYCTVDDFCLGGVCVGGGGRTCGDECNTGTCNESQRSCEQTPLPNDTECGIFSAFVCINGQCRSPTMMCTEGGDCTPSCTASTCNVSCPNTNACHPSCEDGADCSVDCQGASECKVDCDASECTVMCQGTGICDVDCTGGSTCDVTCTDASGCEETDCLDGSECTLTCTEAEDCGFRTCWAGEQQCDDGTVVCGGAC